MSIFSNVLASKLTSATWSSQDEGISCYLRNQCQAPMFACDVGGIGLILGSP